MQYIPLNRQFLKELRKNAVFRAESAKNAADIDYIAMMCDVELENGEETDALYAEDNEEE